MKLYTFQLADGMRVTYEAETLVEAIDMLKRDYPTVPWTITYAGYDND